MAPCVCARREELNGPWRLVKMTGRYDIVDTGGAAVAECWHHQLGEALASAPDLINACKAAVDHLEGGDTSHGDVLRLLRAALRASGAVAAPVRRAS